ncbi:FAD-dependent oxidoreductase [Eubacteriales bacterium OttesenSCG-928-A19]|nr:FAD-dependent oxidoreductase [Eubacteriales bacterium OttesenSCG-928-A19]
MNTWKLHQEIPIAHRARVMVIGGGPAGLCAAIAAARMGVDTLLVEQGGCLGGMATQGLVGPFMTSYDRDNKEMIIRGLFAEIVERLVARGGAIHPREVPAGSAFTSYIIAGHAHVTPFDPEIFKALADEMLIESGARALYHTAFVLPVLENGRITGALLHSKSGLEVAMADVVIDCTGDADVAYRAGVSCELGDEADGRIQPASMFFRIGNVDTPRLEADIEKHRDAFYRKDGVNYRSFHWRVREARENGDWDLDRVSIGLFRGVKEDQWSVNTSRIMDVDGTDAGSLTRAEIEGREQVGEIFAFLRKYVPGCENAVLLSSASTIGIRETRHIRGDRVLTVEDVLEGRVPRDSILLAANSVDVHGRFGPLSNEYLTVQGGRCYGVPYGCLVPVGVEQLLVAGRSVSATSGAAGAIRVMPPCMGIGQAAGVAAALAIEEGTSVRDVDVSALRAALTEQGAFLDDGALAEQESTPLV